MNRRNFLGTVVGGMVAAKLEAAGLVGHGTDGVVGAATDATGKVTRQGAWIEMD